jgi:hypothetical protein
MSWLRIIGASTFRSSRRASLTTSGPLPPTRHAPGGPRRPGQPPPGRWQVADHRLLTGVLGLRRSCDGCRHLRRDQRVQTQGRTANGRIMREVPVALPSERPVSERDRNLRAALTELVVHVPCGDVRGLVGQSFCSCGCEIHQGVWQSCRCEDEPVRWAGCDVSAKVALCVPCACGTAGGTSRWSWLGCGFCRSESRRANAALPLGRHSLMKGAGVQFAATGARQAAQTDSLLEFADNQRRARDWSLDEVWRLAAGAGWVGTPRCCSGPGRTGLPRLRRRPAMLSNGTPHGHVELSCEHAAIPSTHRQRESMTAQERIGLILGPPI